MIDLRTELRPHFSGEAAFDRVFNLSGEVFREFAGRRTVRVEIGGRGYFIKTHGGVGWREIVKNLVALRLPVLGAREEWRAIRRFEELGVATLSIAGFGERGRNPANRQSFLITDELAGRLSLEEFCRDWRRQPPRLRLKRAILEKVAGIARTLHENGVNHRDFYICHFLIEPESIDRMNPDPQLHVIDLHRVQIRAKTPERWIVKDLAGLWFSSMELGLSRRDVLKFMQIYRGLPIRHILATEKSFWRRVERRAIALFRKDFHREPPNIWAGQLPRHPR
ncbi:MAG: lipopolysaccharide core heptose(I) kinase RfaP [Desulfuromonadales bacterium]